MFKTVDEAEDARTAAQIRLHWHLSRAVSWVVRDAVLGPNFEMELLLAEQARTEWHNAQTWLIQQEEAASAG